MAMVNLVVAHNLVFLHGYGPAYGEALARTGHGDSWQTAVVTVLCAGTGLLGIALWRLHRLGILVRALGGATVELDTGSSGFGHGLGRLWAGLTAATSLLFLIQENAERLLSGEGLPGLSVLGSSEYPDALLIIGGVALAVALVGSLIRWRRAILIARLAAAVRHLHRRSGDRRRRPVDPDRRPATLLGRALAVRAPPALPAA